MQNELQLLFDIKKTQLELVSDRDFNIQSEQNILSMNYSDFIKYLTNLVNTTNRSPRFSLSNLYKSNNNTRTLLVYYGARGEGISGKTSIDKIREYIATVKTYNPTDSILIVPEVLTTDSRKIYEEFFSAIPTFHQIFYDTDLLFNPTKHIKVPRHELLSSSDKLTILHDLKTDVTKLPLMKSADPIARYYGWMPGNLIRIHRVDDSLSILSPKSINYRIIIN